MTKVICQHSKIEFEASSTRTKQHPKVASFKNANVNSYHEAMQALDMAAQVGGYTTIDEYMSLVENIFSGKLSESNAREQARRQAEREAEREAKKLKAKRQAQNEILKKHGYRWEKDEVGTEDDHLPNSYAAGIGEFSHYRWQLYAPDGRCVSVEQAMREIG